MTNDVERIWKEIMERITTYVNSISLDSWFSKVTPYCIKDNSLVLLCKNNSVKNVLSTTYINELTKAVNLSRVPINGFIFITQSEAEEYSSEVDYEETVDNTNDGFSFNPKYTFEEFVVSDSNNFVVAAAQSVANNPGTLHNPLFIFGGVGLGKTHLLHAIGQKILKDDPKKKVLYVTSPDFTNEFVDAISSQSAARKKYVHDKYRKCDVLLIDDIQLLADKKYTQDELFNIFNELYNSQKQIVLSSDRPLSETQNIQERLVSRFGWGLSADIQVPSLELRLAILKKKAFSYHIKIDDNVFEYIASLDVNSIRMLEGMLSTVVFYLKLYNDNETNTKTQLELTKEALHSYNVKSSETLSINNIINYVCEYFNITRDLIEGDKRNKEIVIPRQIAMYLITVLLPSVPLDAIGKSFSGKDHTTVMHARDKISNLILQDAKLEKTIVDMKKYLENNYSIKV